jgi:hypothetical protein
MLVEVVVKSVVKLYYKSRSSEPRWTLSVCGGGGCRGGGMFLFKSKPGEEEGGRKDTGRNVRNARKGKCVLWSLLSLGTSVSL